MGRRSPAFRRLRDQHPVMDVSAKDLEIALAGGYPPNYAITAPTTGTIDILPCPAGIWRVVLHASGFPTTAAEAVNGMAVVLRVRRDTVSYNVAVPDGYRTDEKHFAQLQRPIILQPGDVLLAYDVNQTAGASRIQGAAAYVDVPIPPGGGGEFYRVRKG